MVAPLWQSLIVWPALFVLATACQTSGASPPATSPLVTGPGFTEYAKAHPRLSSSELPASRDQAQSLIAKATAPQVPAYKEPKARQPFVRFAHPDRFGFPRVFLVDGRIKGWLHVYLPMEPNGSMGWIRTRDVKISTTSQNVVVDISARRLTVFDGRAVIRRERVAVGTGGTPTPTGRFYITMVVKWSDPSGPYGPYALGLSAWSEVLDSFAGGDGQIAIHGTSDPSSIGRPVSNGCVRMSNSSINRLVRVLPAGTPVMIRP